MKFHYLFILFLLTACDDSTVEKLIFTEVESSLSQDLTGLDILDNQIVCVGGDVFEKGIAIIGKDDSWTEIELSNKMLFDIDCNDQMCIAVGQDGYYYTYTTNDGWKFYQLPYYGFQRSVAISTDGSITVEGKSFASGGIAKINSQYSLDTLHAYDAELTDIVGIDNDNFVAVGYGLILRSNDRGVSWQFLSQEGDFYQDIDFIDKMNGIIVGLSGSILRTIDGGYTWETIKEASTISSNRTAFTSVKYITHDLILAVGDQGLLYRSNDGGSQWLEYQINTNQNLNAVTVLDGYIYVAGTNGYLARSIL